MGRVLDALERARQERDRRGTTPPPEAQDSPEALDSVESQDSRAATPQYPAAVAEPPREADLSREYSNQPTAAPELEPEPEVISRAAARNPDVVSGRMSRPSLASGISDRVIGAHDAQSPITEQVRQIRTNLETVLTDYSSRSIVVTSPISGDGKTLVTANLATILADNPEHQVLLIDADMRKPDQHALFGVRAHPGLSDYLRERCTLEEAIQGTDLPNLKIIPAGHPPQNPTVLLSSDRMIAALGELQRSFHWIIFDTPPLLPVTDASVLARECVGLILVVRMGQTGHAVITRSQELLVEQRLPVLGCILNDFHPEVRGNEYYYRYYRRNGDSSRR